jgi:hypothetical protein
VSCVCGSEAGFVARCEGAEGVFVSEEEVGTGWRDSIIITSWRISETERVARMVRSYGQQS